MGRRLTRELLKEAARVFGREGGKARAKQLSPERRSEIARKAVQARWDKAKKKK
jgi:general stress protein YciG